MTSHRIRYTLLLVLYVLAVGAIRADGQEKQVRFSVVYTNGQPLHDLKPEQIRVRWNKETIQPAALEPFDSTRAVLILMDASVSQLQVLPEQKEAAEKLIRTVVRPGRDFAGVAKFNAQVEFVHSMSQDTGSLLVGIKNVRIDIPRGFVPGVIQRPPPSGPPSAQLLAGAGALFDAVGRAAAELAKVDAPDKFIVIISDGVNTYGETKLKEAITIAAKAGIRLFAIGIADPLYGSVDDGTLRKLTETTGGIAVRASKKTKLTELISQIDNVIRSTYIATVPVGAARSEISIEIVDRELKRRVRVISPEIIY